jgi:hypothetical protein
MRLVRQSSAGLAACVRNRCPRVCFDAAPAQLQNLNPNVTSPAGYLSALLVFSYVGCPAGQRLCIKAPGYEAQEACLA